MQTWVLFVILLVVILIILWILLSGNAVIVDEEQAASDELPVVEPEPLLQVEEEKAEENLEMMEEPAAETIEPDDLKKIEGIGPKISILLGENGIFTFAQLAEQTPEQLQALLDEAGIRIADPTTWAEQAKLAAQDEWEQLADLQDNLKGGRRA
jgi:predicted flap endonuclease-1-like 5' DNA nuclease